jgi:hypothetical protein
LVGYRRLQIRYEPHADILLGFLHLACILICLKARHQSAEGVATRPNNSGPLQQGGRAQAGSTQVGLGIVTAQSAC